jgi:glycerophosphoryl diester phosphodiesterase
MAVHEVNVIDIISINQEGTVVMTISDHLEWDDQNEHLLLLQDKINFYLGAVESGELLKKYPDAEGRNIKLEIFFKYAPHEQAVSFLEQAEAFLTKAGYGFSYNLV